MTSASRKIYNNSGISCGEQQILLHHIQSRIERTGSGCMLYNSSRGNPTSTILLNGKRRALARLLYISKFGCSEEKLQNKRLRRRSMCQTKKCIEPSHHQLATLSFKIYVTTFDPINYKDITRTIELEVPES